MDVVGYGMVWYGGVVGKGLSFHKTKRMLKFSFQDVIQK